MKKVLVTGATGFVGHHLCESLVASGFTVTGTTRSSGSIATSSNFDVRVTGDIGASVDWEPILRNVDYVVHLAARVHVMKDTTEDPLTEFRRVNFSGSVKLAESAAAAGVRRFIYVSTIKVLGEMTEGRPFCDTDKVAACDPYADSKWEAEKALTQIAEAKGLEVVIIRPPLVYGPGVKGNVLALVNMIEKGVPLPLGKVDNRRDLVSIYNLCDLVSVCIQHPAAPGGTFLVSDNESISTPELIRYIAKGLNRNARLFSVPIWALTFVAGLVGKKGEMDRLTGSLQVDISPTRQVLGWSPPLTAAESFRKMFTEG